MKALFYKGEDVTVTFTSVTDMSAYTKVVKFFTPLSAVKTATVTAVDAKTFTAALAATDTNDLNVGTLNVVIEFTKSGKKMISKTIECSLADAYLDGSERESTDLTVDVIFAENQTIQVNLLGSSFAAEAAASAAAALASKNSAETAKTAAEAAKTSAETANTSAQTAKTGAETAKTAAETARDAAIATITNKAVFNVTVEVPLAAGQYYTAATAVAAVPSNVRKSGLEITFMSSSTSVVKMRYTLSTTTAWTTLTNWDTLNDIRIVSNGEFLYAVVDLNDTILFGIRQDGSCFMPKGISEDAKSSFYNKAVFNVTAEIPLAAGQYYTDANAIAAVPVDYRKLGMILVYITSASAFVKNQFLGTSLSQWNDLTKWSAVNDTRIVSNGEFLWGIVDINDEILLGVRLDGSLYAAKADFSNVTDAITALQNGKVDKVTGKVLSTNDYTTEEKTKLASVESGAQVNTFNKSEAIGAIIQSNDIPTAQAVFNAIQAALLNPVPTSSLLYNHFTVAAYDAPANIKLAANYVCDGVNDEVEINACIQAMPRAGGKLILSAGRFNIGSKIILDRVMMLEGQGHSLSLSHNSPLLSNTLLQASADVDVISIEHTSGGSSELKGLCIRDMHISGISRRTSTKSGIYVGMGIDISLFFNLGIDNNYIGINSPNTTFLDAVNITCCTIQRNKLGIYIGYAAFPRITNNIIFDSLGIDYYGLQGTLGTSEVASTPIPIFCGGILLKSGTAIITGNTFGRLSFGDSNTVNSIIIDPTDTNPVKGASGITILGAGASGSIISNNTFSQNHGNCIELRTYNYLVGGVWTKYPSPQKISIIGNSFDNFGDRSLAETKQNAIYIQDSRLVTIAGNTMINGYETGDNNRTWETKYLVYESDEMSVNSIWSGKNIIVNNTMISTNPGVGHVQGSRIRSSLTTNQNNNVIL